MVLKCRFLEVEGICHLELAEPSYVREFSWTLCPKSQPSMAIDPGSFSLEWINMARMTSLTSLKLSCTSFGPGIEHIAGLPLLEILIMQDCQMQPAKLLSQPYSLPSLRTLRLETTSDIRYPEEPFLSHLQSQDSTVARRVQERLASFRHSHVPLYSNKAKELVTGEQSYGILETWTKKV